MFYELFVIILTYTLYVIGRQMNLLDEIENIILLERSNIILEIEKLQAQLSIKKKFDSLIKYIDELDTLFLTNIDIEKDKDTLKKQLKENKNKKLEMWCYIKGKKYYIKSFGTIKNISQEKLIQISRFLLLIKLFIKTNEATYYASQYYCADIMFENLETEEQNCTICTNETV